MKKVLAVILCLALILTCAAGCGSKDNSNDKPAETQETVSETAEEETDPVETGSETVAPETDEPETDTNETETDTLAPETEEEEAFTFNPKLSSQYMMEAFGETKVQAWYALVDAVLAGEDTFACPDQDTYDWVVHQFPDRYFPVFTELIEYSYEPVQDGTAHITYKVSNEEREAMLAEFETLVLDILNKTMKTGYTDFEKVLSLYIYFTDTYTYDYDTYEADIKSQVDYTTAYRLLTGGTGICREIA